jgi:branched-chain amino acid transport system substrate-binding protein
VGGKNKIKTVVTFVSRLRSRPRCREGLRQGLHRRRRQGDRQLRAPLRNPDYAPFLARVKDLKPDALFVFVPSGEGAAVLKQFTERGLAAAGIR